MANWAGLAALFFKLRFPEVRYILTLQEGDPIPYIMRKTRFIGLLFKKIFVKADMIQVISNYLADWAQDMGGHEVVVIPNGVDVGKFQSTKNRIFDTENVVLITTSRLVEKNGVGDIIEAMEFLPESFSLKIIGTGGLEAELKQVASRIKNQESRIKFLGHVPYEEIPSHLHEADIFIRPSLSEGMGNSFIEAMAAGLPVIATPVGGIPDFLEDEKTGLFVEPKSPRLIAFQVQKLVGDRVLRDKITISAKRMVTERYDWNLIANEMKSKVFDPIIGAR
jgi:glycosyltransferase involved in cell wall biosynthesis